MAMEVKALSFPMPDPGADNKVMLVLKAPDAGLGGGLTILAADACDIAATGAGTSFSLALHRYSTAGTPAVNGTIAAAIGGTAATIWAAGVPQAFTIDADYAFLNAGEWLAVDYQEDNTSAPTNLFINVWYALGK